MGNSWFVWLYGFWLPPSVSSNSLQCKSWIYQPLSNACKLIWLASSFSQWLYLLIWICMASKICGFLFFYLCIWNVFSLLRSLSRYIYFFYLQYSKNPNTKQQLVVLKRFQKKKNLGYSFLLVIYSFIMLT